MAQEGNGAILGIALIDDQLRIVEGHKKSDEFQVSQIAQGRVRQSFNFGVFGDHNVARRFGEDIKRLVETREFQVKDAAFSLDSSMVLIKRIPVDAMLDPKELEDHVFWEVRQFSISPLKEYIVDFESLNSETADQKPGFILVVVVRKKIVEFLKQVFKHTGLNLKVVDVDIFSAQRALQLNYDYNQSNRIGLIDLEEKKVNFCILEGRNYYFSQEVPFPAVGNDNDKWDDSATRLISKELRRIVLDNQLGNGVEDLKEIFLYGEAVEDKVLEGLQNSYDVRIDRANPFKKIKLMTHAREELNQERSERFMISVGAALRGIQ
jgi:Tfp pilus assembly PilM family ATPase